VAKAIRAVANDTEASVAVALYGSRLDRTAYTTNLQFSLERIWDSMKTGKHIKFLEPLPPKLEAKQRQIIEEEYIKSREAVIQIVRDALRDKNPQPLYDIGKAIENYKIWVVRGPADPLRYQILMWKWMLDKTGEQMTIRQLAERIEWRDMRPDDGFSQLRKVCKELGFPLAPSRQISKTKTLKVLKPAKTRHKRQGK
jgi:hypothetical protein